MRRFALMLLPIVFICISLLTACSERPETAEPLALDEKNILSVNMEFEEENYELEKEDISELVTLLNKFVPTDIISNEVTEDEKIGFKVNCGEDNTTNFLLKGTKLITDDTVYEGDENSVYELNVFAEKVAEDALQEKNEKDDAVKDEPAKTDTPEALNDGKPVAEEPIAKETVAEEAVAEEAVAEEAVAEEPIAEEPIAKESTSKESENAEVIYDIDDDIVIVDDGPSRSLTEEEERQIIAEMREAEKNGTVIAEELIDDEN